MVQSRAVILPWPRGGDQVITVPGTDRAERSDPEVARSKIDAGQLPSPDHLHDVLDSD